MTFLQDNGHVPQSASKTRRDRRAQQSRRRRRYRHCLPIERRAAIAAGMIKQNGWTAKQAAGVFCVNPTYVGLAQHLNDVDRLRLARGELRLSQLHKEHQQRLAERRAQRLAAEREAKVQAEREAQIRAVDAILQTVGFDRVVDRIVTHFGPEPLLKELDVSLQRSGRDLGGIIARVIEPNRIMRVLDQLTQPTAIAAE
jgi:hypothetical protein